MKIGIVVKGRFVAFDVARELQRRGALAGIVSQYYRAPREGIRRDLLRWNPLLELRSRLILRYGRGLMSRRYYETDVAFGRWAARHLPDADVIQTWTGYGLESIPVARSRGATTVAFRASSHIRTQTRLVAEEFARFGLEATDIAAPDMVERECAEYASADFVHVISRFAYETFLAEGHPAERLLLTPVGVDIGEVGTGEHSYRREGPLRVLFLGTISLRKGVHYLLEAAKRLGPGTVRVSLIGGITPDGEVMLARCATGGERIGKVDRAGLAALFAEHDVLVLPSVEDGFGVVISEAMAAGLPVIASRNSGGPDVIVDGETGYLVAARDVDALVERLAELARDPERAEALGRAGARSIRRTSTWEHYVDQVLAQYAEARARGSRASTAR